ncbi:MAG: aspartyl/asparaginyl beta-hydroxylase domain-containing protein [Novosphingobium sp.]
MTALGPATDRLRDQARAAARQGDRDGAAGLWRQLAAQRPTDPEAANALGNLALSRGEPAEARRWFETALAADPGQPGLLFNFAAAARGEGDLHAAIQALDRALATDPSFVQAQFQKGVLVAELGESRDAARIFRDFLDTVPNEVRDDPRFAAPLGHARAAVAADDAQLRERIKGPAPSRNVGAAISHLTGQALLYRSQPTFLTLPELPAIPFLDRAEVPWLAMLEAAFATIRAEALTLLRSVADDAFVPYVANPPGTQLNQWAGLDHNRAWGAFFLWRHSRRDDANCARMPETSALLERLPLLRLEGRAPNAFLSRLAPRTRIPPHTGVTNARITVHLPLVTPRGCGFRVGPESREWRDGEAWAFDDTIEHEGWNDSDEARLILIVDAWHPRLDPDECAYLARALAAYDAHYGRRRAPGDDL